MEENQEKNNISENNEAQEYLSDFDDEDNQISDIKRDIKALDNLEKNAEKQDETQEDSEIQDQTQNEPNNNEKQDEPEKEETLENSDSLEDTQEETELSQWEELDKNNAVVKKYIIYIAKDFIPYIDNLSTDERSAYINDAIQIKMDLEDEKKIKNKKRKLVLHLIISVITLCIMTPIALLGVNKAILVTFENYKYSQDNFEKLYKQRFEKNKAYMRSVQYNKEHNIK